MATDLAPTVPRTLTRRIESMDGLDVVVERVEHALVPRIGDTALGAALRGRWLGHQAHPLLTDLPVGCWTSAWVLDLVGGARARPAADLLVALGVATALPTAVTGWADWLTLPADRKRVGVVHAATNSVAVVLYARSWMARRGGDRRRGVRLAHLGATVATIGGYLGGHLAFGDRPANGHSAPG